VTSRWLFVFALLVAAPAHANVALDRPAVRGTHDPSFPDGFAASAATGIPFVGIAELSYGVSDAFALGGMLGVTPVTIGVGLRPRAQVSLSGSHRLSFVAPALYYPMHPNPRISPWVLARPVVLWERRAAGLGFGLGTGVVVTASTDGILTTTDEESARDSNYARGTELEPAPFGFWETVVATTSLPLGSASSAFAEAGVVFDGFRIADDEWVGGPPVIVVLGVSRQL
jgi:hypothetical protein